MELINNQKQEEFIENNIKVINSSNVKRILWDVYEKVKELDIKIFYDFLGEVFLKKPHLNEDKIFKKYFKLIKKEKFPPDVQLELEAYLIEKYCIFDNEEILLSFHGEIKHHKVLFTGRVFLTNFRIIVIGWAEESSAGAFLKAILKNV
jgi:hypothetical protein